MACPMSPVSRSNADASARLPRWYEYLCLVLGLGFLGLMCLGWTPIAAVLYVVMPEDAGRRLGRRVISGGFNAYIHWLEWLGACRFELDELDSLRTAGPLVLAPNHPSLLDAVMVVSRLPDVACIMKASLMDNLFLGGGARLARYIRNKPVLRMVHGAVEDLQRGSMLLVFPEGTRTVHQPINRCQPTSGLIARRARVPVQTLLIETDSAYLSKGWSLFRRPDMPIRYRVRLGARFDPPADAAEFALQLEQYFAAELARAELVPPPCPAASA